MLESVDVQCLESIVVCDGDSWGFVVASWRCQLSIHEAQMWYGLCCNCHIDVVIIIICMFIIDERSKKIWLHLQNVRVLQHSKSYKVL